MECMKCGAVLGQEDYCPACGADVKIYKKIIFASNRCYNDGLECAKIRNLSGAVESLKKSLKYYKMNMQARNLLGLVYFEMGETVDAINEWVISRSLIPENNRAEEYLASVQSNGNKLDALNQTIKKYNQVLLYCRQDSKDLAIIQLKKVLSMNPKMVKGHQLLALLYMEAGNYEQAKRALRSAAKIDANNSTTFRYMREVNAGLRREQPDKKKGQKEKKELVAYQSGNETIIYPADFKDNSAVGTILNIIVGAVIGVLIMIFLIVPGMKQSATSKANDAVREANDTISTKNQTIKSLENQVEGLETQIAQIEKDKDNSQDVLGVYEQLLTAYDTFVQQDVEGAGAALRQVDASVLSGTAKSIYDKVSAQIDEQYIVVLYQQGEAAFKSRNYQEAAAKLQQVVDIDSTYGDSYALHHLAQSYQNLGDNAKAAEYFQKVIEQIPGTQRAKAAEAFLQQQQIP